MRGWARVWRILGFAFVCAAPLAPSPAPAQELSNRTLLEYFDIVAFNAEHETRKKRTVLKWTDPVNIAVIGQGYPDFLEKLIVDHIADLRRETGHDIRLVYSDVMQREGRVPENIRKTKINLPLFILPRENLPKAIERNTKGAFKAAKIKRITEFSYCFGQLKVRRSTIPFAFVAISAEVATQVEYGSRRVDPKLFAKTCVVEELTQVLGLINDSDALEHSIFNDSNRAIDLTDPDRWLLRLLYDDRLLPGMPRKKALKIAERILKEKRPDK